MTILFSFAVMMRRHIFRHHSAILSLRCHMTSSRKIQFSPYLVTGPQILQFSMMTCLINFQHLSMTSFDKTYFFSISHDCSHYMTKFGTSEGHVKVQPLDISMGLRMCLSWTHTPATSENCCKCLRMTHGLTSLLSGSG